MLNIEKYKNAILNYDENNINCCVNHLNNKGICFKNCKVCKQNAIEWLLSEYKEPVLDDAEKEYLSAVIKPFRNKVKKIAKISRIGQPEEQYIRIVLGELDFMNFPNFNTNTGMYKGMEADRLYSLEELGL